MLSSRRSIFVFFHGVDGSAQRLCLGRIADSFPSCYAPCATLLPALSTTRIIRTHVHKRAHIHRVQVLFDMPDFMIISAYTLLAVVWAEAFLQVCAVLSFFFVLAICFVVFFIV